MRSVRSAPKVTWHAVCRFYRAVLDHNTYGWCADILRPGDPLLNAAREFHTFDCGCHKSGRLLILCNTRWLFCTTGRTIQIHHDQSLVRAPSVGNGVSMSVTVKFYIIHGNIDYYQSIQLEMHLRFRGLTCPRDWKLSGSLFSFERFLRDPCRSESREREFSAFTGEKIWSRKCTNSMAGPCVHRSHCFVHFSGYPNPRIRKVQICPRRTVPKDIGVRHTVREYSH